MIESLQQKKILIIVILLTVMGLVGIGYIFASKKSEPVYTTKIDRIMFDTKNKSPKYVITLPDRVKTKPKKDDDSFSLNEEKLVEQPKEKHKFEPHSLEAVLSKLPSLGRMTPAAGQVPLPDIDRRADFVEDVNGLKLPKIYKGQKPWVTYGRKVDVSPKFRRVSVVIKNLGINPINTGLISKGLPSEVSLSFSPYAIDAAKQIKDARQAGHETYVDLLLSSKDFLKSDTGPMAMSLTASVEQNMERLNKTLAVDAPVGGVVINPGVTDDSTKDQMQEFLLNLKNRGLLLLDATAEDGVDPIKVEKLDRAKADFVLEDNFSRGNIRKILHQAEEIALQKGKVIIVSDGKPVVIEEIRNWVDTFSPQLSYEEMKERNITEIEKPFALVPISNLVVE